MVIAAIIYLLGALMWMHENRYQFAREEWTLLVIMTAIWPLMFVLQAVGEYMEKR